MAHSATRVLIIELKSKNKHRGTSENPINEAMEACAGNGIQTQGLVTECEILCTSPVNGYQSTVPQISS